MGTASMGHFSEWKIAKFDHLMWLQFSPTDHADGERFVSDNAAVVGKLVPLSGIRCFLQ